MILVVLEGLSDSEYKELNGKTPLEYAETPNMDALAERGRVGKLLPVKRGLAPESDQVLYALMGEDVLNDYTGRGIIEAIGSEVEFSSGELILKARLVHLNKYMEDCSVRESKVKEIVEIINDNINISLEAEGVSLKLVHVSGHENLLLVESKHTLSSRISNSDPLYTVVENHVTRANPNPSGISVGFRSLRALNTSYEAEFSAGAVNKILREVHTLLKGEELNCMVTRGASIEIPPMQELGWAFVSLDKKVGAAVKGIRNLTGMTAYNKFEEGVLEKHRHAFIHSKLPDLKSHENDPEGKAEAISRLDEKIGFLMEMKMETIPKTETETPIILTGGYTSECRIRAHSAKEAPILFVGKRKDGVKEFNEKAVEKGTLRLRGNDVLALGLGAGNTANKLK